MFEHPEKKRLNVWTAAGLATATCVLIVACGPSTTSTGVSAPSTTSAPAASNPVSPPAAATAAPPTLASVPTAVARPTQTTTTTTTSSSTASASTDAAAGGATLVLDAAHSSASYHARETLVGRTLPSDAVGTSTGVSGTLILNADGSVAADRSKITVDVSQLHSDQSRRDNFIKGNTLETDQFPMAVFVPNQVQGLSLPLPTSGQQTFQMLGNLTVHGVTKPVTWQVSAQFADKQVSGNATTDVNISDFGMTPPKAGPVLSIQDGLTLELAFTALQTSA